MGFDNECILNIQSLAGEYFCPVCRLLVYPNEAIQSQCTHLYCKPCLTYVVSTTRACPYDGYLVTEADSKPLLESNKDLADTISKIAVHCLYHRSGCTWQGPLSECTSHCSDCSFGNSPVVCNRCGIQIVHRQVQEHAQNCPGVQSQTQQTEGAQGAAASGTTVSTSDQSQTVTQAGASSSQPPISQAAAVPGQDPNQQVNTNTQAQAVAPTTEQWYQQQQYQQYYQQYPGYDPYQQQYQHYYPYQQQAVQQYQQVQPSLVPGQSQPQVYVHPPQPQTQPQSQAHSQPQPQVQLQPQSQPQPMVHAQIQPHPHVQAPMAAQSQNQMQVNSAVQPLSQIPSQTHAPAHGQLLPQAPPFSQSHQHPQPLQPHPVQHPPIPQNQQPHSQMQYPHSQVRPPSNPQHSQHHSLPQPKPHQQALSQAQLQHHSNHPQPRPPAQLNQTPNANPQSETPHLSSHAVSGHHSYPQPHPYQQMPAGPPQHHPMHMPPQSGALQHPQHLPQMPGQLPQQPPQLRPPQSHGPLPNQQQPVLLPPHGQVPNVPPSHQQPVYPPAQQPGHPVQQRPVMHSMQQAVPPQFVQQQQPIQPALRPQVPPQSLHQLSGYPQSQQNVGISHNVQSQPPSNHVGRPMMPNQGMQPQPFPQSHGGLVGAAGLRPTQPASGQLSANQNYMMINSEHQLSYVQQSAPSTSVAALKPAMLEKQGNNALENSNAEGSQKANRMDANGSIGIEPETIELKSTKLESDIKLVDDEQKLAGEETDADPSSKDIPESRSTQSTEPEDSSVKQIVKQKNSVNTLETSGASKFVDIAVEEQKDVSDVNHAKPEHSSFDGEEILEAPLIKSPPQNRVELKEEESGKLQTDVAEADGVVLPLTKADKSSEVVPGSAPTSSGRSSMQLQGKGYAHPLHQAPLSDPGRHQLVPTQYGPSPHQQRPDAAAMLHPVPPQGPSHQVQVPGYPPIPLRPQVPDPLFHPGQPLTPREHFQTPMLKQSHGSFHPEIPPGGNLGAASAPSIGRGSSHSGPYEKIFELHPTAHGHYDQGPLPFPPFGVPKSTQAEHLGGPPHPGLFDSPVGMMARVPAQHHQANPMEAEMIPNQRSSYMERGPIGHSSAVQSNLHQMDPPPVLDSSSAQHPKTERFKPRLEEHMNPLPMEQGRHVDRREFEDLRQFPRPPNSDGGPFLKAGSYISSSRSVDRGPHGLVMDAAPRPLGAGPHGFNYDDLGPNTNIGPPRFLPPYQHDDINGRPDFIGQVPGFGRRHVDGRSPAKEYPGIPPRGFGGFPGAPGVRSGLDDTDDRASRPFGAPSKSFDLSDPVGNPYRERYPVLPNRLRRGDFDGPGNLRMAEDFPSGPHHSRFRNSDLRGQDMLPNHFWRGEPFGPRSLRGHLRQGEPTEFGAFPLHPRLGEPGFRSSYSLQGYANDGFYAGETESFDNPRKRKLTSMGWCRICKVDCETVEGLDLHSQTREHQKMAMDMVLSIKKQNLKKHKTSNDHSSLEEVSKSRNTHLDDRGNKH